MHLFAPSLAFVDLETTGTAAAHDRITEVGIVRVDGDPPERHPEHVRQPGVGVVRLGRGSHRPSGSLLSRHPERLEVGDRAGGGQVPEVLREDELGPLSTVLERLSKLLYTVLPLGAEPPSPSLEDAEFVNETAQNLRMTEADRQDLLERNSVLARARALVARLAARGAAPDLVANAGTVPIP